MLMNLPEDRSPKIIRFVIEPEKLAPFKVDFPIDFKFDREEGNRR
jgi:hypothetical protein